MRTMEIPPFLKPVEISDIEYFTNTRLRSKFSLSEQAAALADYSLPQDEAARTAFSICLTYRFGSASTEFEGDAPS